jgi:hypothetical protein
MQYMKDYYKITKFATLALVLALGLGFAATVRAVEPGTVSTCLAPTSIDAYVNPFGVINLSWLHGANTSEFIIQVLPSGEQCGSANVLKEITVPGTTSWYTLPTELSCGFRTLCIKATCCDDRCDSCQNLVGKDEDYCTAMAGLYTNRCACKDQNSMPVLGSFKYKCAVGNGIVLQTTPCANPAKNIGCTWDCNVIDSTAKNKCGLEYDVQCGKGPDGAIVGAKPNFNLCSVSDSRGYKQDDSYLVNPPGVYPEPGTKMIYRWKCAGARSEETCKACRRAVCSTKFQNKFVNNNFAKTSADELCRDENGDVTATATKPVKNPETGNWEWDCIGNETCGENKNHVASFMEHGNTSYEMKDHCMAQSATCGWANGERVTYETWQNNGGSESYFAFGLGQGSDLGNFWCGSGGRVQNTGWEKSPIHQRTGVNPLIDTLKWNCVYGDEDEVRITCGANLVSCNSAVNGKNLTQKTFDSYKQTMNLCTMGDGRTYPAIRVGLDNNGEAKDGKFTWTCQDILSDSGSEASYSGREVTKCSANEVACLKPPADGFVANIEALKPPLCTAGKATTPNALQLLDGSGKIGAWYWTCIDDFGDRLNPQCQASRLACAKPPHDQAYEDWDDLINNGGAVCSGSGDARQCTGICNKNDASVLVTFNALAKTWTWNCGDESCKARFSDCAKPPHQGMYLDLEDFVNKNNAVTCDMTTAGTGTVSCCGVCSEQGASCKVNSPEAVPVSFADNKFTWTCGAKACEAEGKCKTVLAWADDAPDEYCADKPGDQEEVERTFTVTGCANPSLEVYLINLGFEAGTDSTGLKINANKIIQVANDPITKKLTYKVSFRRQAFARSDVELKVGAICNDTCAEGVSIKNLLDTFDILANRKATALDFEPTKLCSGEDRSLTMIGKSQNTDQSAPCTNYEYTWTYEDALGADNAGGWLAPNDGANYKHVFARLSAGSSVKAQVRCVDDYKCLDKTPATKDLVVEQSKVASSVKINESCLDEGKPITATATGINCSTFEYRWTVNGGLPSAWTSSNSLLQTLQEKDEVKVEARCADTAGCIDRDTVVSDSQVMEKEKSIESVTISPDYACSAYDQKLNAVLGANSTCKNTQYRWKKTGDLTWGIWSPNTEYLPASTLKSGQKISLEARCVDTGACVNKEVVAATKEVTVKLSETVIADAITGYSKAICAGDEITLTANVNEASTCEKYSYQWYLDGEAIDGATAITLKNEFADGAKVKVRITCTDDATKCPPVPNFDDSPELTIEADPKVVMSLTLDKVTDAEPVCAGKELTFTCEVDGGINKNKLLPLVFAWSWEKEVLGSTKKQASTSAFVEIWKAKFAVPAGQDKTTAKVECAVSSGYDCVDPASIKLTKDVPVINCGCGAANNTKHTKAYFDAQVFADKSFLCQNGATVKFDTTKANWSWTCTYPDETVADCQAEEVTCGDLALPVLPDGKLANDGPKYTPLNWSKNKLASDLCSAGVAAKNGTQAISDVTKVKFVTKAFGDATDPIMNTQREWTCEGQGGATDKLVCGNAVVDCGTGDAERYAAQNKRIRPRTNDGLYHGSFPFDSQIGITGERACLNTNLVAGSLDVAGTRGAYTWICGGDSDGNAGDSLVQCAARKDCGWPNDDQNSYATVYFNTGGANAAGCWTAENIKNPDDNAVDSMAWHRAVGVLDQVFYGAAGCGYRGCNFEKTETTCPAGWLVPTNNNWHKLEDLLDADASACVYNRLTLGLGSWQCDPAAQVKSEFGYGLKSKVTFSGNSGEAYWTKTMACDVVAEGGSANYCLDRTGKRDRIACVGSQIGAVPKYLTITPFYFKLDGTDKVGRMSEANWCQPNSQNVAAYKTPAYSHQLRCVKDDSAGAIKKPDNLTPIPVTIKCTGIGCYRRQGI